MNDKKRRVLAMIALCLGFAVLYFIIVLTALNAVGTDSRLYYSEQMKAGVLPGAGISEAALFEVDAQLADYLSGARRGEDRVDDPQAYLGVENPVFNEKELTHLRDCLGLFDLLRRVRSRLIPWAIVLILGGAYILRDRQRIRLCAWLSPLILLVPLGAFALYAALDFDAAFTLFHKILFTNDLWLLDPRTDLLIRICPQSMFMHMGIRIAVFSLTGIAAVSVAAMILTFTGSKRKEDNAWKTTTRRGPAPRQYDFGKRGTR